MATVVVATDTVSQYVHRLTVTVIGQDPQANTSRVKYAYTIENTGPYANGSWTTLNNVTFHAIIDGTDHTASPNFDFRNPPKTITVMSGEQTITHGADGTKTFNVRLTCNALAGSIWFFAADSGNKPITVTPLDRASDFTLTPNPVIDGETVTIDIDRTDDDYTHLVEWETETDSGTIDTDAETSATWTPDSALLGGETSVGITITVTTFDGVTQIGDPVTHDLVMKATPVYPEIGVGTPYDLRIRRVDLESDILVPKETIPYIEATTTDTLSASGSLKLTVIESMYPTDLDEQVVVADVFDGSQWLDAGMVFVLTRVSDDTADVTGTIEYEGMSYADFLLSKAIVTSDPKEATRTPGQFIQLYFDSAKDRGWGTHLVRSFSATQTSLKTKWKNTTEQDVSRDTQLSQLLDGFISDILAEYRSHFDFTNGRVVLDMHNPGYGSDWTVAGADPIVNLQTAALFKVIDKAPVRKDYSNKLSRIYVRGDEKASVSRTLATQVNPIFGHLEGSIEATGVKKTASLNKLGDAALDANATATVERTFSYDLSSNQTPPALFPYRTFRPGDWILIPGDNGLERSRVSQVAITRDADGTTATITTGDLIPSGVAATARKLAQVGGGAIAGGTLGAPLPLSSAIPAAPLALDGTADGYWDATGAPKAGVEVTWQEVDTSLSGSSILVDLYEVWTRPEMGNPWTLAALTTEPVTTLGPLNINQTLDIEVRARSAAGIYGDFSDVLTVTTPEPDETLPAPANPTLEANVLGTVSITWNGLIDGDTPPLWFAYLQVEISDLEAGGYTVAGQQLLSAGTTVVDGVGAGTWWFRLVGYDTLGVRGAQSASVGIVVEPSPIDTREPKAPTDVAATSEGYWNGAQAASNIMVSWTAVTEGIDNDPIDIVLYEVWGKLDEDANWQVLGSTDDTAIILQPPTPLGATWNIKVRAQAANNVFSAFSEDEDVVIDAPDMALLPPTAPSVSSVSGLLLVDWDGKVIDDSGSDDDDDGVVFEAPGYLASVDIQISVDEGDTWSTVGFLVNSDTNQTVGGLGVGTEVWVRLVGFDILGQESDPSNISIVTIIGIDGDDLIAGTVNANKIVAGSISADLVTPSFGNDLDIAANGSITLVAGQAADAQAAADSAQQSADDIRTRYDFTPTEAVISQPGSAFSVAISNTQLEFRESGVARAYLNAGVFNAPRMASGQLVLQYHVIENDPDGTVIRRL